MHSCMVKMPNCTQYSDVNMQRPEFIEKALQTQQPAKSKEYRCVGFVVSFDLVHAVWITLPCDMKFSATFICEDISNNTSIYNQNLSAPNVSTSFHLIKKDDHLVLNKPHVNCPYPWLPAKHACFTLKPAKRPKIMSSWWLTYSCDLLNASTFIFPNALFDRGMVMPGRSDASDLLSSAAYEMKNRGLKMSFMKAEHLGECVSYFIDVQDYQRFHCVSRDTDKLPELVHVLCTSSFPGETITYDRIATYTCNSSGVIISASFLCDGIIQCKEGDDEISCVSHNVSSADCSPFSLQMHKNSDCLMCPQFYITCGNGVCVPQDALCNGFDDCDDGWDEQICVFSHSQLSFVIEPKRNRVLGQCKDSSLYDIDYRCILEHDGKNNILHCVDGSHVLDCVTLGCPRAYKCSLSYCIPLRQVCDGMSDCLTGEDEASCGQLQCTGLFQCRQSARCLPPWDICDGTVHCKDFLDDEIYCAPCPHGMRCHGNAAVCIGNTDVGMLSLTSQSWVKVVHCHQKASVQALSAVVWHTLTYLDIQHSEISHLDFDLLFPSMKVLSYLNAAFNKIVLIRSRSVKRINILNLSHNMIAILTTFGLRQFPKLVTLVLHHNDISVIQRRAFFGLKVIVSIDITHNPLVIHQASDLPQESYFLEHFHGDILAVCCLLSHVPHCTPRSSLFSSCENLLHLTVYRVLITGQAVLTFTANSAVLIFRRHLKKKEQFQIIQLTASNLLMSMYFMMVASVDIYYRDRFAAVAVKWKYLSFL